MASTPSVSTTAETWASAASRADAHSTTTPDMWMGFRTDFPCWAVELSTCSLARLPAQFHFQVNSARLPRSHGSGRSAPAPRTVMARRLGFSAVVLVHWSGVDCTPCPRRSQAIAPQSRGDRWSASMSQIDWGPEFLRLGEGRHGIALAVEALGMSATTFGW